MGSENTIEKLKFGLIGKKLGHSFSKVYFEENFNDNYPNPATYKNFEIENEEELKLFCKTKALKLNGFNITIPYKETILPFLDNIDKDAKVIGAVNTVKIENNKLIGYNTDWVGFVETLIPFLKSKAYKALILGTGGASKAVAYGCQKLDIPITFVSSSKKEFLSYHSLTKKIISKYHLIINTTPLGMYPKSDICPDIPYEFISSSHVVMDLIYNPKKSLFLANAESKGATIINGQKMLEIQAQKAWEIWLT